VVLVTVMGLSLASCQWVNGLRADQSIELAHRLFQTGHFVQAAAQYEDVLTKDPTRVEAHHFLAISYDRQYERAFALDDDKERLLCLAIEHYVLAVDLETDPERRTMARRNLLAAYGPDKANDPAAAETILSEMIAAEPASSEYYFTLATLYEESGRSEDAERVLSSLSSAGGDDALVWVALARAFDRLGQLDLAIGALRRWVALEPENPEALYTIATFYRKEAMEDSRLTAEEHAYLVPALAEVERALTVDDDYVEALRYKDTLLRMRAQLTVDAGAAAQMVVEANLARDRAAALQ
jgi:tetratricopeptide (TPR) repeat protein